MKMDVYRDTGWLEIEVCEATNEDLLSHISAIELCESRRCSGDADAGPLDGAVWSEALRRMEGK